MNRIRNHGSATLALLGIAVLVLTLAGCGRKGGLDLPPSASAPVQPEVAAQPEAGPQTGANPLGWAADPAISDPRPTAAKGQKRRIILDPLLD